MDKKRIFAALDILSSTSSSSESSDEDELVLCLQNPQKRAKIINYLDIVAQYSDEEFKSNFRIHRRTYIAIKEMYEASTFYPNSRTCGRLNVTPASTSILSFLWYVGNKCSIRNISSRFGLAESTFHLIMKNVMDFLANIAPNIIKFPTSPEGKEILAGEFKKISGFPDVLGCIDGTYIPIRMPSHKLKSTYTNRHDMPSITLQAICDHRRLFLDVFTGTPSKIHDARVFKLSFISKKLPNICGEKYHILGDAAYPLKPWLLTPYRNYGNLTERQKIFNYKFSQTRVKIENSFGLLKIRFRQLLKVELTSVERISQLILSCCVLHNLCIMNKDEWSYDESSHHTPQDCEDLPEDLPAEGVDKKKGEEKRHHLCNNL